MVAAAPTGPTLARRFQKKAPSCLLKEGKNIIRVGSNLPFLPQTSKRIRRSFLTCFLILTWLAKTIFITKQQSVKDNISVSLNFPYYSDHSSLLVTLK